MHTLTSEDMLSAFDSARRAESTSTVATDSEILPVTPGHQHTDSEALQFFDTLIGGACTWNQEKHEGVHDRHAWDAEPHHPRHLPPAVAPWANMLGAWRGARGVKHGVPLLEDIGFPGREMDDRESMLQKRTSYSQRHDVYSSVPDIDGDGASLSNIGVVDLDIDEPSSSSLTLDEGLGLNYMLSSLCSSCSGSDSGTVKILSPLDIRKSQEEARFSLLSAQEPWMPGEPVASCPEDLASNDVGKELCDKESDSVIFASDKTETGKMKPEGSSVPSEGVLWSKEVGSVDEMQPDSLETWCRVANVSDEEESERGQGLCRVQVSILKAREEEDGTKAVSCGDLCNDVGLDASDLNASGNPREVLEFTEVQGSWLPAVKEEKPMLGGVVGGSAICTELDENTTESHARRNKWRLSSRKDSEDFCGGVLERFVEHHSDTALDVRLRDMVESRPDWEEEEKEEQEEEEPLTARDLVCDSLGFLGGMVPRSSLAGPMSQWEDIDLSDPNFYSESDNVESARSSADGMEGHRQYTGGEMLEPHFIAMNSGEKTDRDWVDEKMEVVNLFQTEESALPADHVFNGGAPPDPVNSLRCKTRGTEAAVYTQEVVSQSTSEEGTESNSLEEGAGSSASGGLPPGGGAPPGRANSADLNSWEQMQEAMVVSKTMKRVLSSSNEDGDEAVWDQKASRLITVDTEISAKVERETGGSPSSELSDGCAVQLIHHNDPFECLLDSPSAVGHKRLQTVLEESSMGEELLDGDKLDLSDAEGSVTTEAAGEPWVFDRAGLSPPNMLAEDAWGSPSSEEAENARFPRLFHIGAWHRGRMALSEGHKGCHVSAAGSKSALGLEQGSIAPSLEEVSRAQSAPCHLFGVFDGFSALDSEVSEIFGQSAPSDVDCELGRRTKSRGSDPGGGGDHRHTPARSLSPKEQIFRWLRAKLTFRSSPEMSSEHSGADTGSLGERNSCVGRLSSVQSRQSSEVISSISLSDMVTAPSPSPVEGPHTFELLVNANIYEPIEWGPGGPRQLYSAIRPKLEAAGVDIAKWDTLSNEALPVIEFFDGIVQDAEEVGLNLFSVMEDAAGKGNALVLGLREALGRAEPNHCGCVGENDQSGQDYDRGTTQWQVQLDEGRESLEQAPSDWGRGESGHCSLDVLDVLSECGINAMFFDRDMSTFSSESEYYGYLADCLKSEGAKLTPGLMNRLGHHHPLSVALCRQSLPLRDSGGKRQKSSIFGRLKSFFNWQQGSTVPVQKPSQKQMPGCWNGLKKEVSRRCSRRHTVSLPL